MPKQNNRKRGRPAKSMPRRINAPPEKIAQAIFADNDSKLKKREKS